MPLLSIVFSTHYARASGDFDDLPRVASYWGGIGAANATGSWSIRGIFASLLPAR